MKKEDPHREQEKLKKGKKLGEKLKERKLPKSFKLFRGFIKLCKFLYKDYDHEKYIMSNLYPVIVL